MDCDAFTFAHVSRLVECVVFCGITGYVAGAGEASLALWPTQPGWMTVWALVAFWVYLASMFGWQQQFAATTVQSTPHSVTLMTSGAHVMAALVLGGGAFSLFPPPLPGVKLSVVVPIALVVVWVWYQVRLYRVWRHWAVYTAPAAVREVFNVTFEGGDEESLLDRFADLPWHTLCWLAVTEHLRVSVAYATAAVGRLYITFASMLAPPGLKFWAYNEPVPDDPLIEVGACFMARPQDAAPAPGVYHCNIGHMDTAEDFYETNIQSYFMLKQLTADRTAGEKGFTGDLVCEIPITNRSSAWGDWAPAGYRQVNLSAWRDQQAAHDWYVSNKDHKAIVRRYHNRGLTSFSASLAHLEAAKPIRYQVRCRMCHRVQKNWTPEVTKCSACQATLPKMPYF
jgi:hypothetical protein